MDSKLFLHDIHFPKLGFAVTVIPAEQTLGKKKHEIVLFVALMLPRFLSSCTTSSNVLMFFYADLMLFYYDVFCTSVTLA